jgi:pyruvate,water dikinase
MTDPIVWLSDVGMDDVPVVGGKNASLGEMLANLADAGVTVPGGFATTASAFREFLADGELDRAIEERLSGVDVADVVALAAAGQDIRSLIEGQPLHPDLDSAVRGAYLSLGNGAEDEISVAVRSSATAEDLPEASFAGQQDTFLNVRGADAVVDAVRMVFASLFTDRAIAYRVHQGFAHRDVAISAGVQRMVRSDLGSSGVAFTIDTETGFEDVVFITSAYGLGELLVQGQVNPDEFYVYKPSLRQGKAAVISRRLGTKDREMIYADGDGRVQVETVAEDRRLRFSLSDEEIVELARQATAIEEHYGRPMDVEWARDGADGKIYIVQARPETVRSQAGANVLERFSLRDRGTVLVEGRSVGQRIGVGRARVIRDAAEMGRVGDGDVLVADMTDPDWEPVMARAAAIVTNRGGRTCHAAIIARELGIPAVVGTGEATMLLSDGAEITVSCAEGDTGYVYEGVLDFETTRVALDEMPDPPVQIMMNVASPDRAFGFSRLPNHGVGLARLEFIINTTIAVHPRAIVDYPNLPDDLRARVEAQAAGYRDPRTFFVEKLKEGVATIAAAFAPKPVIVRLSDFKSNEYAGLPGGDRYEPLEENPMIGFRGASRYRSPMFAEAFAMECEALRSVRADLGFDNVAVMVPFVRTPDEAADVVKVLKSQGIVSGEDGLRLIMMCEVPSNAIVAEQFLDHFDGFSIGSNDLTQFTLALDRDSGLIADMFDETNDAVKSLMSRAIDACKAQGKYIGICGQGPSDHPDLARWLAAEGIDSISLNPDSVIETWLYVCGIEPA